jgi:hypothetical protein
LYRGRLPCRIGLHPREFFIVFLLDGSAVPGGLKHLDLKLAALALALVLVGPPGLFSLLCVFAIAPN